VLRLIEEKTLAVTYKQLLQKKIQPEKEQQEEKLFALDQKVGPVKGVEQLDVDGTARIQ
jgi:hypothetical protein